MGARWRVAHLVIVASATYWRGRPAHCLEAWVLGKYDLAISHPILTEYEEVIARLWPPIVSCLRCTWDIGRMILERQKAEGWGAKVIDRLSRDLQNAFPGQQGFSPRNLKYVRAFAEAWPETLIVQQPVAQLAGSGKGMMHPPGAQTASATSAFMQAPFAQSSRTVPSTVRPPSASPIVQAPLAQLPWYHQVTLLDKLAEPGERLWYAAKALEHGWSRDVLASRKSKPASPPPKLYQPRLKNHDAPFLLSAFHLSLALSAFQRFSVSPLGLLRALLS